MNIPPLTKADEQRLQEAIRLVVCHHPAIGNFMDGLGAAIQAAEDLEALPSRDDNGFIDNAAGFAHTLRTMRDVLECLRPAELDLEAKRPGAQGTTAGMAAVNGGEWVNGSCEI